MCSDMVLYQSFQFFAQSFGTFSEAVVNSVQHQNFQELRVALLNVIMKPKFQDQFPTNIIVPKKFFVSAIRIFIVK